MQVAATFSMQSGGELCTSHGQLQHGTALCLQQLLHITEHTRLKVAGTLYEWRGPVHNSYNAPTTVKNAEAIVHHGKNRGEEPWGGAMGRRNGVDHHRMPTVITSSSRWRP